MATVLAQTRGDVIRPGDYDGQEEVTRIANHARCEVKASIMYDTLIGY